MKKSSLNALLLFAGIAYLLMMIINVVHEFEDAKMGYIQGLNAAKGEEATIETGDVYYLTVEPKENVLDFPETIHNQKYGIDETVRFHKMKAFVPDGRDNSIKVKVYNALLVFVMLVMFSVYLFIPFQFYEFINAVNKGRFYETSTIKRIDRIGRSLLLLYFCFAATSMMNYNVENTLFKFENYNIVREKIDVLWLLLGLVFMIIAAMFQKGIELKKENELTI